jgi:hypothetical protein
MMPNGPELLTNPPHKLQCSGDIHQGRHAHQEAATTQIAHRWARDDAPVRVIDRVPVKVGGALPMPEPYRFAPARPTTRWRAASTWSLICCSQWL